MKPTWPIYVLQKLQGQLFGVQFFMYFLNIIRDFDGFISAEIRSHILAPRVLIDSLSKCTVWIFVRVLLLRFLSLRNFCYLHCLLN